MLIEKEGKSGLSREKVMDGSLINGSLPNGTLRSRLGFLRRRVRFQITGMKL